MVACEGRIPLVGEAFNRDTAQPPPAPRAPTPRAAGAVVAIVDGQTVPWSALRPLLTEAAGGQILSEWVVDSKLSAALRGAGLQITAADVAKERQLMLSQLAPDADQSVRLLQRLRETRGLGPVRFARLLERNAGLRKLAAPKVQVTPAMVQAAWQQAYGEKSVVRMILVDSLVEAQAVIRRVNAGESFVDLAMQLSKDESRRQGGLLPAISAQDATFPQSIRDVSARLGVGQVSNAIQLDRGFAILRGERKISAAGLPLAQVEDALGRQVRLRQERNLMQQQVRVFLQEADVSILDGEMARIWKQQRGRILQPN